MILMQRQSLFLSVVFGVVISVLKVRGDSSIVVTYEAPGVQSSTVVASHVFNFDDLDNGTINDYFWTYGAFSGLTINDFNVYGGAGGSGKYLSSTDGFVSGLYLSSPVSYFGFWWSSGNSYNVVDFYNNTELICSFDTSVLGGLSENYNGNPNLSGANPTEKYAFLNFFMRDGGTFNRVEARGYNFESDNWTIREASYGTDPEDGNTLPGTPAAQINTTLSGTEVITDPAGINMSVPEPSALSLLGVGLGGLAMMRRRRS